MIKKGFTLIELLVVIAVIALLMSVILPSLNKAKQQARMTVCLSNLKQAAIGALTYETDSGRLPSHLWEISMNSSGQSSALPTQVTMGLVNPNYDVRQLYADYINVNYFKCPLVPQWSRDVHELDNTYNIYTDYFISGGYWANLKEGERWSDIVGSNYQPSRLFTKSEKAWEYQGVKYKALFGDSLWKRISSNELRTNHPGKNTSEKFVREAPNPDKWVAAFYYGEYTDDDMLQSYLGEVKSNYVFADGSAETFKGDDDRMVEVLHRRDNDYSFYIPRR